MASSGWMRTAQARDSYLGDIFIQQWTALGWLVVFQLSRIKTDIKTTTYSSTWWSLNDSQKLQKPYDINYCFLNVFIVVMKPTSFHSLSQTYLDYYSWIYIKVQGLNQTSSREFFKGGLNHFRDVYPVVFYS